MIRFRCLAWLIFLGIPVLAAAPASALDAPAADAALIAADADAQGGYRLGVELALPAGWHTYWRNPGDAGIPPSFDFSGSDNLAGVKVDYPLPMRLSDDTGVSLVYEGRVVLPLTVTAADPGKPVELRLRLDYGLCNEICVPAEADLSARLAPGVRPDPVEKAELAAAAARVPEPLAAADSARLTIRDSAYDPARMEGHVEIAVAEGQDGDLLASVASPWYASPPEAIGRDGDTHLYRLVLSGPMEAKGLSGLSITFTLVDGDRAFETERRID